MFDVLNVACGGHAGDDASMERLARFIAAHPPLRLGAHPSYPDRANFGRRSLALDPLSLRASLVEQCTRLAAIARRHGLAITSVKLHGALYHDANRREPPPPLTVEPTTSAALAPGEPDASTSLAQGAPDASASLAELALDAIVEALGTDVAIIGPPLGAWRDTAIARGLPYLREGFADRARRSDGTLVPRSEPNALITDPAVAAAQARLLADEIDTLCVHADTPGALAIARAVRAALLEVAHA